MTQLGKYHVLRFDKGYYDYQCESGLQSSGPWDNRPKQCAGIGCRRELVEQSTLDAAIESAATTMRDKCVEKVRERARSHRRRATDISYGSSVDVPISSEQYMKLAAECDLAADELESLTLDQVKPGEM